jgi:signal transduction histidine kinase
MTIKRRIRIALSLMIALPAAFMALTAVASRLWTERPERFGPGGSSVLFTEAEGRFLAEFNRLSVDEPEALADPARLAALDGLLGDERQGGWAVYRDGRELFRSRGADGKPGALRPQAGPLGLHRSSDFRWSFRFADGARGLFSYSLAGRRTAMGEGVRPVFLVFIAAIILCNGLLSWWAASGIVPPLARLKAAAVRIGDGDLGFALERAGDDELGDVATAFETMRGKLLAALERQLAEETARKELVAHVSHDLRTPVAIIRGHAEGLRDGVASTPEMRDRYLGAILERARELEALIELLFDYARIDLQGARGRIGSLALSPFLTALRDSMSRSFPDVSISIDCGGGPGSEGPVVAADPDLTRRAMANLVDNAVKHGGRPSIAIEWRMRASPGSVEVAVSDDGAGVPDADLPRLFEPFFRGDRSRARGGSGLGLAIVRKIMEAQGGRVRASRASAGGLEVTLVFAAAAAETAATAEEAADGETDPDRRG